MVYWGGVPGKSNKEVKSPGKSVMLEITVWTSGAPSCWGSSEEPHKTWLRTLPPKHGMLGHIHDPRYLLMASHMTSHSASRRGSNAGAQARCWHHACNCPQSCPETRGESRACDIRHRKHLLHWMVSPPITTFPFMSHGTPNSCSPSSLDSAKRQ